MWRLAQPFSAGGMVKVKRGNPCLRKRLFWQYLMEQRSWLIYGSVTGFVMNTSVVLPPILLGRIIDRIQQAGVAAALDLPALGWAFALYLGAVAVYAAGRVGKRYGFRVMANRMNCRLRADLLAAVFGWPLPRYDQERIGDIMSRAIGDVQSFVDAVQVTVTEVFDTGLMMLSNFVALILLKPSLALAASATIPLAIFLAQWMGPSIFARATRVREAASLVSQHLWQSVGGVRVYRLLGREEAQARRFEDLSRRLRGTNVAMALLQGGVMPLYSVVASLGVVLVIGWGARDVLRGVWTVGAFSAFLTMFVSFAARTLVAAQVINRAYVGAAAWRRLEPKLAVSQDDATPAAGSMVAAAPALEIRGRNLSFVFPGTERPAVRDLDFTIPAGAWVGVTGPIGSGKTALSLALSGLYPYLGSLTYGGRELSAFSPDEKVRTVAYLGQEAFLFSSTIAENVSFRPLAEADRANLEEVSRLAAVADDLSLFPQGYETPVGEVGVRVSGGQRQRIALARALYARTPVLVLDDPFSAVDLATERRMVERLRESQAFGRATVVMFSHRLASFAHVDRIYVLGQGTIVEQGSHAELLAAGDTYARILRAQQWMEEHGA